MGVGARRVAGIDNVLTTGEIRRAKPMLLENILNVGLGVWMLVLVD
jgi:hypothetical protein